MKNYKEEDLIRFIADYEDYVDKGNQYLKLHFNVSKSPLIARREGKIPRHGKIDEIGMSFEFHGIGCMF